MTADQAYDFDAGLTEVDYAVAETGTLVIRHRPEHGRLLSLVPFVHVAIVQPKQILPDLIDLFETLAREGSGSGVSMISGPSKTADIEMNTVTGVHGPNVVKAFFARVTRPWMPPTASASSAADSFSSAQCGSK